tara:strand:+ start:46 stop:189 length:144 start_codon:yes stop_codon:yes gene_type:complete
VWIVIENPGDQKIKEVSCQYLTDMLEAVKAAAVKPDVVFISIEKEEN